MPAENGHPGRERTYRKFSLDPGVGVLGLKAFRRGEMVTA